METLIVINYEGEKYKSGNIQNIISNFERDSGLRPSQILDQVTREELYFFFQNYSEESNQILIHIKAHGSEWGICQIHPDSIRDGDKNTLIKWQELILLLNLISQKCNNLIINLGTVCYSTNIKNCNIKMNFHTLVTNKSVSDPVIPRKLNKVLLSNIEDVQLEHGYELIRK